MSLWISHAGQGNAREKFASVSPSEHVFPQNSVLLSGACAGRGNVREKFASISPSERLPPRSLDPAPGPGPRPWVPGPGPRPWVPAPGPGPRPWIPAPSPAPAFSGFFALCNLPHRPEPDLGIPNLAEGEIKAPLSSPSHPRESRGCRFSRGGKIVPAKGMAGRGGRSAILEDGRERPPRRKGRPPRGRPSNPCACVRVCVWCVCVCLLCVCVCVVCICVCVQARLFHPYGY